MSIGEMKLCFHVLPIKQQSCVWHIFSDVILLWTGHHLYVLSKTITNHCCRTILVSDLLLMRVSIMNMFLSKVPYVRIGVENICKCAWWANCLAMNAVPFLKLDSTGIGWRVIVDIVDKRTFTLDPSLQHLADSNPTHFLDSPNWNQFIESEMFKVCVSVSVLRL